MTKAYVGFVRNEQGNMTTVAEVTNSRRAFENDLRKNGHRVIYLMNYDEVVRVSELDGIDRINWVHKTRTAWKQRDMVLDYIDQCMDIIADKVQAAKAAI